MINTDIFKLQLNQIRENILALQEQEADMLIEIEEIRRDTGLDI